MNLPIFAYAAIPTIFAMAVFLSMMIRSGF
jgi:hypothetical protein